MWMGMSLKEYCADVLTWTEKIITILLQQNEGKIQHVVAKQIGPVIGVNMTEGVKATFWIHLVATNHHPLPNN